MVLKTSAGAPITCSDWDDLTDEDGFLAKGRNRYHCSYVIYRIGTRFYAENGTTGNLDFGGPNNLPAGTVDGTSAVAVIQAAINALPTASEGEIYIRKGQYPITEAISLTGKDSITIRGENRGGPYHRAESFQNGTYLYLVAGSDDHLIEKVEVAPSHLGSIVLQDLGLDGNCDNQTPGGAFDVVYIAYTKELLIERCIIQRGTRNAVRLTNAGENVWVKNNRIQQNGNGQHALYVFTSVGTKILDNVILGADAATYAGVYFENTCAYSTIKGNAISDNEIGVWFVDKCDENRIVDNSIAENDSHGVYLQQDCDNNIIALNEIRTNGGIGLLIADYGAASENNYIIGNKITANTGLGVSLTNLSDENRFFDNDLLTNVGGAYSDTSTGFNITIDNEGWNPQAAATPAVGGSPVTFGPYAYPMMIGVVGGTITSVTIRAQATGQAGAGSFAYYMLYPSDTCIIVYTIAPTVYTYPQ